VHTKLYNTEILFPCFPLYCLAVYIVHIHGFSFYLHGSRSEPHRIDSFEWLLLVDGKQHGVQKGATYELSKSLIHTMD